MATQPADKASYYGSLYPEMDQSGYTTLNNLKTPPLELLNGVRALPLGGAKDAATYYFEPQWNTELFRKVKAYVEYDVNVRHLCDFYLDGLDPKGKPDLIRVVCCRKNGIPANDERHSAPYMLGPQDYRPGDAFVLVRPILDLLGLSFYEGSHRLTGSQFDQKRDDDQWNPKLEKVGKSQAIAARSTLWCEWPSFFPEDAVLFAFVIKRRRGASLKIESLHSPDIS